MPDLPEEAVQAAALALAAYYAGEDGDPSLTAASFEGEARAALEAALPALENHLRQELGAWLVRVGQQAMRDKPTAPGWDKLDMGWAGAFIGAGVLVEGGYPKRGEARE